MGRERCSLAGGGLGFRKMEGLGRARVWGVARAWQGLGFKGS